MSSRPECFVFVAEAAEFGWRFDGDSDWIGEKRVEGFQPQDLAVEDMAEVAGDGFGDTVEALRSAKFLLHRGYGPGCDSARNDEIEVAEVDVDVEREAVGSDRAGDVNADSGNFGGFSLACVLARCFGSRPDSR